MRWYAHNVSVARFGTLGDFDRKMSWSALHKLLLSRRSPNQTELSVLSMRPGKGYSSLV